jgi:hypothetical protein
MKAIDFVARRGVNAVERGSVAADAAETIVNMGSGIELSLNLQPGDMQAYSRQGDSLEIVLADGRIIVLDGYFVGAGENPNRLFISSGGTLNEVSFIEGADGALFAQYGTTAAWGKWSPDDELIFVDDPNLMMAVNVDGDQDVSMLGAGLLGGMGLLGGGVSTGALAAGAGAAALVAAGSGTGTGTPGVTPTPDDTPTPGPTPTPTPTPTPDVRVPPTIDGGGRVDTIGGDGLTDAQKTIEVTGTAMAGSVVTVVVGGQTQTVTAGGDGTWSSTFNGSTFPADGSYVATVTVVEGDGTTTNLTGQSIVIDTTPPVVSATEGTLSSNDQVNRAAHDSGKIEVAGTGEAGATIDVTIDGTTHSTTVAGDGTWSVEFDSSEIAGSAGSPGGRRDATVEIVTTDTFGNSFTTTEIMAIDTVDPIAVSTSGTTSSGDKVNKALHDGGTIEVAGTGEAGATIDVTIDGTTHSTTVAGDGSWSVEFDQSEIAGSAGSPGGRRDATVEITTTDSFGNSSTLTETMAIDTVNPDVAATAGTLASGYTMNAAANTVALSGTSEANAQISVVANGVTKTTVADGSGNWSVSYTPAELGGGGDRQVPFTVTATDSFNNATTENGSIDIDTIASAGIASNVNGGGDNLVNAADAGLGQTGVQLTGTSDPGTTAVAVTMNNVTLPAVVQANGDWTVTFPPGTYAQGTNSYPVSAVATDAYGNQSAPATSTVRVDTEVQNLSVSSAQATGTDGITGLDDADGGVVLTGTMEAAWADLGTNSTVMVMFNGQLYPATVNQATGTWSVTIPESAIPANFDGPYTYQVTGQDSAGNSSSIFPSVEIDTIVPDGANVTQYSANLSGGGQSYSGFTLETSNDDIALARVETGGSVTDLAATDHTNVALGPNSEMFVLDTPMSNGQQLIVTESDDAGNTSGTYVVLNDGNPNKDVSNANLGGYDIETIELGVMDNTNLTLTEADIAALSGNTDTVAVRGGVDDQVNIVGATANGTATEGGINYNVYELGATTILIEDDITNVTLL